MHLLSYRKHGHELEDPWDASFESRRVQYGCVLWLAVLVLKSFGVAVLLRVIALIYFAIGIVNFRFKQGELRPRIVKHQQECRPKKTIETRHINASHHRPCVYRTADHDGNEHGDVLPS